MSPRPRQASDEAILMATASAMRRLGPVALTLADVAKEAGVSAAAIVQRFGSKRDLLLAAASGAAGGHNLFFEGLRAKYRSPLAALLGMSECMAIMGSTPKEIANTLAFLQIDLTDDDFHQHAYRASAGTVAGIRTLVTEAIQAGELVRCDARRLAAALHATMNGSLLNWAIHREGTLAAWVRRDLGVVLEPYKRHGRRVPQGKGQRAKGKGKG